MIKLAKPDIKQKDVIDACMANLQKEPTLSNITKSRSFIEQKSNKYNDLGEKGELGNIPVHTKVLGGATKDDMVWLYDKERKSEQHQKDTYHLRIIRTLYCSPCRRISVNQRT
jgi:hypothetical protein